MAPGMGNRPLRFILMVRAVVHGLHLIPSLGRERCLIQLRGALDVGISSAPFCFQILKLLVCHRNFW